jgi:hypothetical protein
VLPASPSPIPTCMVVNPWRLAFEYTSYV